MVAKVGKLLEIINLLILGVIAIKEVKASCLLNSSKKLDRSRARNNAL